MISNLFTNPFAFILYVIALVTAITIHEYSHAWAADKLGDPPPRLMGRLTLNPLAHLDTLGTLMLLLVSSVGVNRYSSTRLTCGIPKKTRLSFH